MSQVATGLASGHKAQPSLAADAVQAAMQKGGIEHPTAVLLFLTSEFAANPASAIKAAAKTAGCTQVIGCSAAGIFTEEDWILDSPAAAAMVFGNGVSLTVMPDNNQQPSLTLTAPNAINTTWLNAAGLHFGGVSGDATGHGPFSVWQNGKSTTDVHCEVFLNQAKVAVAASHGLEMISSAQKVTEVNGHDLLSLGNQAALDDLTAAWRKAHSDDEDLPFHQLVAMTADTPAAFEQETYHVAPIIASNQQTGAMTLSQSLNVGQYVRWGLRNTNTAQVDIVKTACQLQEQLGTEPAFAMLFSCLGRGPSFYNGSDQDLALIKSLHPKLPIIGFYGNGEIAPIAGENVMLQYAAVLALFSERPNA